MRKMAGIRLLFIAILVAASEAWSPTSRRQLFVQAGGFGTAAAGAMAANAFGSASADLYTPSPGSLNGQVILITGGTTGLGLESAQRLATGGASIILTARTADKGKAAVEKVRDYVSQRGIENVDVRFKVLDLDDLQGIKQNVASWKDVEKIDVLLNNAGVMAIPDRQLTVDGIERTFQSNHLGHFALTSLLASKLSPKARIINVSSAAYQIAGGTGLLAGDALWSPDTQEYGPWKAYGQSKLANILFTEELQRRSDEAGLEWSVCSLHPGAVQTDLARNMMGEEAYQAMKDGKATGFQTTLAKTLALFIKDIPDGATTQVWLAAKADDVVQSKAQYFDERKARSLPAFAKDQAAATRLWEESEERAGLKFKF